MDLRSIIRYGTLHELKHFLSTSTQESEACNARDHEGLLPIQVAVEERKWEVVRELALRYPETVLSERLGWNPILHELLSQHVDPAIVNSILQTCPKAATIQWNVAEASGTLLHFALSLHADISIIESIVEYAPSTLRLKDQVNGSLPLHLAFQEATATPVLQLLLKNYPEALTQPDFDGQLPLHLLFDTSHDLLMMQTILQLLESSSLLTAKVLATRDNAGYLPIHLACNARAWNCVAILARAAPSTIEQQDPHEDLPLHIALAMKAWSCALVLQELYPAGAQSLDRCHRLPLHAVMTIPEPTRDPLLDKLTRALVDANPSAVQVPDDFDSLILHTAVCRKDWDLCCYLLELFPAGANHTNRTGDTPWMYAARYGSPEALIEQMLDECKLTWLDPSTIFSPLDLAIEYRQWGTAAALAKHCPELARKKNRVRLFPIQSAALQSCPESLLSELCRAYPEIAAQYDKHGNTLTHVAVMSRKWRLVKHLVLHYEQVAAVSNAKGEYLLQLAIQKNASSELVLCIFGAFLDIEMEGRWGLACILEHYRPDASEWKELIEQKKQAFTKYRDREGNSNLHLAITSENMPLLSVLLEHGENVFEKNTRNICGYDLAKSSLNAGILDCMMRYSRTILKDAIEARMELAVIKTLLESSSQQDREEVVKARSRFLSYDMKVGVDLENCRDIILNKVSGSQEAQVNQLHSTELVVKWIEKITLEDVIYVVSYVCEEETLADVMKKQLLSVEKAKQVTLFLYQLLTKCHYHLTLVESQDIVLSPHFQLYYQPTLNERVPSTYEANIWSAGNIIYEAFTGEVISGETQKEIDHKVNHHLAEFPRIKKLLLKMLKVNPTERKIMENYDIEENYIGRKVRKLFDDDEYYSGIVKNSREIHGQVLYDIEYEDGDVEEIQHEELLEILIPSKLKGKFAKTKTQLQTTATIWLAYQHKLVAMAKVLDSSLSPEKEQENEINVQVTKICKGSYAAELKKRISSSGNPGITWNVKDCFLLTPS